jgi:hypothetical protein
MKHIDNDTTATIATAVSGSATVIHFSQTWQPVAAFVLALVGIVSGLFAIVYWSKKIKALDGKK